MVFEIHCIPQNTAAHAAIMSGGIFASASPFAGHFPESDCTFCLDRL